VNRRRKSPHEPSPAAAKHNGTALGRLLQDRRESAGYSRARVGELVGLSPGTIEGWEVGRVRSPAIHDVLRLAHFLQIPFEEIQRAVFADRGEVATVDDFPAQPSRRPRSRRRSAATQILEASMRLFGWDDAQAAEALGATTREVRRWQAGAEEMPLADFVALSSMIGLAAAEALGSGARLGELHAATAAIGVSPQER
jgi:transcriptional regulator with XRE-family HTH domain